MRAGRRVWWWVSAAAVLLAAAAPAASAPSEALQFQARVSTTHVRVGEPVELTLSLSGPALDGAAIQPLQLPQGWSVTAERQSQQLTLERGQFRRQLDAVYVLVPHAPGTFQLGPFTLVHQRQTWSTDVLTIVVDAAPAPAPPTLTQPPGGRVTL